MSTFKKTKVVMLSTNEKAKLQLTKNYLNLSIDEFIPDNRFTIGQHLYILSDEEIKEGDWFVGFADGSISPFVRQADKSTVEINNWQLNKKGTSSNKKIIATTDKSLFTETKAIGYTEDRARVFYGKEYLPQPSQSFIGKFVDEYNKGNVITEVLVEYNEPITEIPKPYKPYSEVEHLDGTLKISKDNTITIRKVKDSWSTEEMRQKLNDYRLYAKNSNLSIEMFDKWIEENL